MAFSIFQNWPARPVYSRTEFWFVICNLSNQSVCKYYTLLWWLNSNHWVPGLTGQCWLPETRLLSGELCEKFGSLHFRTFLHWGACKSQDKFYQIERDLILSLNHTQAILIWNNTISKNSFWCQFSRFLPNFRVLQKQKQWYWHLDYEAEFFYEPIVHKTFMTGAHLESEWTIYKNFLKYLRKIT